MGESWYCTYEYAPQEVDASSSSPAGSSLRATYRSLRQRHEE